MCIFVEWFFGGVWVFLGVENFVCCLERIVFGVGWVCSCGIFYIFFREEYVGLVVVVWLVFVFSLEFIWFFFL